jgi:t-SNARE complex subunit (syntaxin)
MALKIEEHVVYVESMKTDMIPYSVVKEYLNQLVKEQEVSVKEIRDTVDNAEKEIASAIGDLTKEITNLQNL